MTHPDRTTPPETTLSFAEYGQPDGRPIFYFHGWPGSRFDAAIGDRAARDLSLRIIAPDRPGMGGTPFEPRRQILDWPGEIEKLADRLGLDRFGLLGVSGGCPYTLACALRLAHRVNRVAIGSGVPHPEWLRTSREVAPFFRIGSRLEDRIPGVALFSLRIARSALKVGGRLDFLRLLQWNLRPHDRQALGNRDTRILIERSIRESFHGPAKGLYRDLRLLTSDWGFTAADIEMPVRWWHGAQDHLCPINAVRDVVEPLRNFHLEVLEGEGHYSLPINHVGAMLHYLAEGR